MKRRSSQCEVTEARPTGSLWTAEEDASLRAEYPCYEILQTALPHRSLSALKHRVRVLGIVHGRHVWTNIEVRRLRAAFEDHVPDRELEGLFPGLRLGQIKAKAGHIGATHRKGERTVFGVPALDSIRERARSRGMSYVELDKRARTGKFFQNCSHKPMLKQISRAAATLGGEVIIDWGDQD